ncbi:MAG: serine hydrolase domain-containing protein [Promethearchaeota archaeon]
MTKEDFQVNGFCDAKFEPVKDAFIKNFEEGLEVGASFAATINGKFVIDIWAGYADAGKTRPWEENTIVNVYSTTKIMTALCTLMLVDRGLIDIEAPVAKYWPEFAQAGKDKIPVKYLLSHCAGLAGFEKPIKKEDLYDWNRSIELLAEQKPMWEPGSQSGYHAITFGQLLGELVRRVSGKSLGTFFREEIASKINADFHIGFGKELDSRVADLVPPTQQEQNVELQSNPLFMKALFNPFLTFEDTRTREWRSAEIPASNGHGNARSIAKIGSILANGGSYEGIQFLSNQIIEKAIEEQISCNDLVLMTPIRFGLGFGLNSQEILIPRGTNPRTFYWGGLGGSVCVMDPDAKLCYAYAMNQIVLSLTGDPRTKRIIEVIHEIV